MLPQPQEEGNCKNLDKRYIKMITFEHQTWKHTLTRCEFFTTENVAIATS